MQQSEQQTGLSPTQEVDVYGKFVRSRALSHEEAREVALRMLQWVRDENPRVSIRAGGVLAQIRLGDLREEANGIRREMGDQAPARAALSAFLSTPAGRDALSALAPALVPSISESILRKLPENTDHNPLPNNGLELEEFPQEKPLTPQGVTSADRVTVQAPIQVKDSPEWATAGPQGTEGTGLARHPHERRRLRGGAFRRGAHPPPVSSP